MALFSDFRYVFIADFTYYRFKFSFSAEQCVKLLEHVCQRETAAVYDAGGLQCMLSLVRQHGQYVHKVMLEISFFCHQNLKCKIGIK